jgi:hypothetical protein
MSGYLKTDMSKLSLAEAWRMGGWKYVRIVAGWKLRGEPRYGTMIERRFGPLSAADRARIQRADAGALLVWGDRLLSARSLAEVFVD